MHEGSLISNINFKKYSVSAEYDSTSALKRILPATLNHEQNRNNLISFQMSGDS